MAKEPKRPGKSILDTHPIDKAMSPAWLERFKSNVDLVADDSQLNQAGRDYMVHRGLSAPAIRNSDDPPIAEWIFEPGLFRLRGYQHDCTPVPLAMLKYMVENPRRASFSDNDFLDLRGVDAGSVTAATIGKHISDLRSILRKVAKAIKADSATQDDPLPKKSGGWRFLLPRQ